DVALAVERQQVMLAHAEEVDAAHEHHLVVVLAEDGAVQRLLQVLAVPLREEAQRFLDALRCAAQPLALRVLAELAEQLTNQFLHGAPSWKGSVRLAASRRPS